LDLSPSIWNFIVKSNIGIADCHSGEYFLIAADTEVFSDSLIAVYYPLISNEISTIIISVVHVLATFHYSNV